jgi:hypothetical protein
MDIDPYPNYSLISSNVFSRRQSIVIIQKAYSVRLKEEYLLTSPIYIIG